MSSVNSVRIPGLATGMDTDSMIKDMLTGEQNKIDKVKQKEQIVKWQQEIYRDVIKEIKGFQDDYFSITSPKSIISSKAWNTLSVSSSDSNVITASGSAGASDVNYKFDVIKLAQSAKVSSKTSLDGTTIESASKLKDLGLGITGEAGNTFTIKYGEGESDISKPITIRTEPLYEKELDADGNPIVKEPADDINSLIKKINESSNGEVKANFSEMTGEFTIENSKTGSKSKLEIKSADGTASSDALDFLGMKNKIKNEDGSYTETEFKSGTVISGSVGKIDVYSDGNKINTITEESNSFTIDGIKYDVHTTGSADMTSKTDAQPVVENMKKFVENYNKIMDKVYDLVTEKGNRDYQPLTEEQKKDMDEDEIKRWEEKAKKGVLRNDSEMRRFMDHMQNAIFGEHSKTLNEFGLTTHPDYNKKGQLSLDTEKFTKAIQDNGEKVYDIFASGDNSVMEKMKDNMYKYVGTSSSLFAKKAGIEKTASVANNFYSEQIKQQQENIKNIQRKMQEKEQQLYQKFAALEASMNKFNSQMNHLMGQ